VLKIWQTFAAQSDLDFAEWWNAYWSELGHQPCPALDVLGWNGIDYPEAGFVCGPDSSLVPGVGVDDTVEGQAGHASWRYFHLDVPPGAPALVIDLTGLPAVPPNDVDLYVRRGAWPTEQDADCVSASTGSSDEQCALQQPASGRWYISVRTDEIGVVPYTLRAILTCDGSVCDDTNICTDDTCSPDTGECTFIPNVAPCDDGDLCTADDACAGGFCVSGQPVDCDDTNECTDDACDPSTGNCSSTPNTATCDDGNACTVADSCSGGICVSGSEFSCDDGNICTDDSCDPLTGNCTSTPNPAR